MKKYFSLFALLFCTSSALLAQVKITDLPAHSGDASTSIVPIVTGGVTKQTTASNLSWGKLENVVVSNDSIYVIKNNGQKIHVGNVTGKVLSFNNRVGAVVPANGDYTVGMVTGAVPNTLTINGYQLNANITLGKADVQLGAVPNVDATNPANITQTSSFRFVTDAEKTTWNGKQNAIGYTTENVANKATDLTSPDNTKYPTVQAVSTALAAKQNTIGYTTENVANKATNLTSPDNTKYPTTLAISTALAGKADTGSVQNLYVTGGGIYRLNDSTIANRIVNASDTGSVTPAMKTSWDSKQAGDADLTALAALSGTNNIYYRSGADTWSPVTIGSNLTFTGGTLSATGGGGGGSTTVDVIVTRTLTNKDTCNFDISALLSAGYNVFEFFYQLKPAVDEDELFGRFSENGTTWVTASNYAWFQNYQLIAGSGNGWSGNAADHWGIAENVDGATTNTFGVKGQFAIINPNTAENRAINFSHIKTEGSGTVVNHWGGLYYNGSSVLQGFQFYFSAGNIASGFIKLRASK